MTPGELRFATRLHTNLDESFHCWFDIPVGQKRSRYPDFLILHADLGLLCLEVKDWKRATIQSIDKHSTTILAGDRTKRVANPMEQARQCTFALIQSLENDQELLQHGGRYQGRLTFPFGYGVVFPNIASQEVGDDGWTDLFPDHRTIYRDQMTEGIDSDVFRETLEKFFDVGFSRPLTSRMMDRVRWHIFPEIRIANSPDLFDVDVSVEPKSLDRSRIRQLDIEQEKFARQIGTGHRVIRGVAGSGKTQIIAYRCHYFAEASEKPVLVLYYNIAAKALLRSMLKARGVLDRVEVAHFHQWCATQVKKAKAAFRLDGDVIQSFADALEQGSIDTDQYSAVMVDEGKDFEDKWLKLITRFCEPKELPLLFVYDDAQSIYEHSAGLDFSMASVGIKARGRTTVMKTNYRNSEYTQQVASKFLHDVFSRTIDESEREEWLQPVGIGNIGIPPKIVLCSSFENEIKKISRWVENLNEKCGVEWSEICIIVRKLAQSHAMCAKLATLNIPSFNVTESREAKEALDLMDDSVKVATIQSSKGLEFPNVAVSGLCSFDGSGSNEARDARLLYVAMTRSTHRLVLTAQRETELVKRLDRFIEEVTDKIDSSAAEDHEI